VVIKSGELAAFLGMISPVEHCAASASQATTSIITASQHGQLRHGFPRIIADFFKNFESARIRANPWL
jgi:hypothetical protein